MEGHSEGVQDEVDIVIYVRRRLVLGAADVVVVVLKKISRGALGTNVIWLDGGLHLDRLKINQEIFIMYIFQRNHDVLNPTSDVVEYENSNSRLTFLIEGGRGIKYHKPNVFYNG